MASAVALQQIGCQFDFHPGLSVRTFLVLPVLCGFFDGDIMSRHIMPLRSAQVASGSEGRKARKAQPVLKGEALIIGVRSERVKGVDLTSFLC